jgi:hypothetical protein
MDDATADRLRGVFRRINPFMVAMWRLGLGRWVNVWPVGSGRIFVLGHTGRRTGSRRWTPLNYAIVDGELYCTAGFAARAAGIDPRRMDDESLAAAATPYCLLRIRRAAGAEPLPAPLPAHPRPGDLSWWWAVVAFAAAVAGERRHHQAVGELEAPELVRRGQPDGSSNSTDSPGRSVSS